MSEPTKDQPAEETLLPGELEREDRRLAGYVRSFEGMARENERLRQVIADLQRAQGRMGGQLQGLRSRLEALEREGQELGERYAAALEQSATAATLYTASFGLCAFPRRDGVLTTIRDIIINLVGSEELAIVERDSEGRGSRLVLQFGMDPLWLASNPAYESRLHDALHKGERYVRAGSRAASGELSACLPLRADGCVTGAVAIFGLLEQKEALSPVDHEIFDLLETAGGTALYLSSLTAQAAREVQ